MSGFKNGGASNSNLSGLNDTGREPLLAAWRVKLKKFKGLEWIALIVLIGVVGSIALSDFGGLTTGSTAPSASNSALESRLSSILSSIDGAGTVEVMIYEAAAETSSSVDWLGGVSNTSASQAVGVVVVADGAGDVRVRLELIRAVQTLMDLPAGAVEVFQRKTSAR
ncbi:MAG: hypothetical protein LBB86_03445 [Oscillospiraceae bacterium]|nr:hypothetical protein [Oscillospiraceae bacterium]